VRVLFYVQNLLGIGHIVRAIRIARAINAAGDHVELVLGGVPVAGLSPEGLSITQLTPIRAGDAGFSDLVLANGQPVDDLVKAQRIEHLLARLAAFQPDVVLIEAYPFGRRQMRFELTPLIAAARAMRPRPLIVSSIRDILQESRKSGRDAETVATLTRDFDHVIVHGDANVTPLSASFARAADIAGMTLYSGFVAPSAPTRPVCDHDVIVSVGGGAVGFGLMAAALAAKPTTAAANLRWLAITGPNMAPDEAQRVEAAARANAVDIARFVPDLTARLCGARLSISQAGYNTVADLLVARCRAVVVPFVADGETEQTKRAQQLETARLAVAVPERGLDAAAMAAAIDRALALPEPGRSRLSFDGATRTAASLRDLVSSERAG
jgi:predicted glycosyltransferase